MRTGHVSDGVAVPGKLPDDLGVVWRMNVGEGLASPVVAGGKVFYFDNPGGKETLHAIDPATAKEFWRKKIEDPFRDMQGPSGPRCTRWSHASGRKRPSGGSRRAARSSSGCCRPVWRPRRPAPVSASATSTRRASSSCACSTRTPENRHRIGTVLCARGRQTQLIPRVGGGLGMGPTVIAREVRSAYRRPDWG